MVATAAPSPLGKRLSERAATRIKFVGIRKSGSLYLICATGAPQPVLLNDAELHCGPDASDRSLKKTARTLLQICGADFRESLALAGLFARRILKGLQGDHWRLNGADVAKFVRHWRPRIAERSDLRTLTRESVA